MGENHLCTIDERESPSTRGEREREAGREGRREGGSRERQERERDIGY